MSVPEVTWRFWHHPVGMMAGHPLAGTLSRQGGSHMQRTDLAYLLVGVATAAERRARAAVETSAHITAAVAAPAVAAFEATPLAAPVRRRAAAVTDPLIADGRDDRRARPAQRRGGVGRVTSDALDSRALDAAVDRVLSSGAARRVDHDRDQPSGDRPTARQHARQPRRAALRRVRLMDSRFLDEIDHPAGGERGASPDRRHVSTSPEVRAALSRADHGPRPGRDGRRACAHGDRG